MENHDDKQSQSPSMLPEKAESENREVIVENRMPQPCGEITKKKRGVYTVISSDTFSVRTLKDDTRV